MRLADSLGLHVTLTQYCREQLDDARLMNDECLLLICVGFELLVA